MTDDKTTTRCGRCRTPVRRPAAKPGLHPSVADLPLLYTRTLVRGEFLASCSEEHAVELRRQANVPAMGRG